MAQPNEYVQGTRASQRVNPGSWHSPLGKYLADPNPIVFNNPQYSDRYFLYCTEDGYENWGATSFHVYTSPDLVQWHDHGTILDLADVPWGHNNAWAPTILERGGSYYLYFVCEGQIGAAQSHSPYGPFVSSRHPIVSDGDFPGYHIDPSVFSDKGIDWLIWGNGIAYAAPILPDGLSIDHQRICSWTPPNFREAMWIFKRKGIYYASWSENDARDPEYCVHYATAADFHGPWTEHGVLIEQNPAVGIVATAHQGIVHIPGTDTWILAYHLFDAQFGDGFCREIKFAPLTFRPDGTIEQVIPSEEDYRRPLHGR